MTSSRLNLNSGTLISTHILTKRMTALCRYWHNLETFQLTSSRRGWPVLPCTANLASVIFQLTSSRRGWPYQSNRHGEGLVFQLTSSRRGWRLSISFCTSSSPISTHILTKRMTIPLPHSWDRCFISTHILTKRMTSSNSNCTTAPSFQLTSSRRGWPTRAV